MYSFVVSGMSDHNANQKGFSLYPNPARSEVFINTDFSFNSLEVKICDPTEKQLNSVTFSLHNNLSVDLPRESGVNLIQLSTTGVPFGNSVSMVLFPVQ